MDGELEFDWKQVFDTIHGSSSPRRSGEFSFPAEMQLTYSIESILWILPCDVSGFKLEVLTKTFKIQISKVHRHLETVVGTIKFVGRRNEMSYIQWVGS